MWKSFNRAGVVALFLGVAAAGTLSGPDLTIRGSDTTSALMKALAKAHVENGGAKITVEGGGSGKGAQACIEGQVPMAFLSRKVKDAEKESGLVGVAYAIDGVAIIVNKDNPITELKMEELKDIFSGKTETWADGKPISAFNRNTDSGTRECFKETVLGKDADFGPKCVIKHDGVLLSSVAKIRTAIAFTSLGEVDDTVKIVKINGVMPTGATMQDSTYPIRRTLHIATKGEAKDEAKTFIAFVLSAPGQKIVTDLHYVSLAQQSKVTDATPK